GCDRLFDRLQLLAGFEAYRFARRNVDFGASARVAADAGLTWANGEHAKAAQLNTIAARQRLLHALKHRFDRHLRLGLGDASLGDNFVDQIKFDHKWLRRVLPARRVARNASTS